MDKVKAKLDGLRDHLESAEHKVDCLTEKKARSQKRLDNRTNDIASLKRKKELASKDLQKAKDRLQEVQGKLHRCESLSDKNENDMQELFHREDSTDGKLIELEIQVAKAKERLTENSRIVDDTKRHAEKLRVEHEAITKRHEIATSKILELEQKRSIQDKEICAMQNKEYHRMERFEELEKKIQAMEYKLKREQSRLEKAVHDISTLTHHIDVVERERKRVTADRMRFQEELDQIMGDIEKL